MTDDCMKIRECANNYLSNMSIIDSDATINKILFELSESDERNLDIKKKTLAEIKNLLDIKQKLKVKNDDIYFLKNKTWIKIASPDALKKILKEKENENE